MDVVQKLNLRNPPNIPKEIFIKFTGETLRNDIIHRDSKIRLIFGEIKKLEVKFPISIPSVKNPALTRFVTMSQELVVGRNITKSFFLGVSRLFLFVRFWKHTQEALLEEV